VCYGDITVDPAAFVDRNLGNVKPFVVDALLCLAVDRAAGQRFAMELRVVSQTFETEETRVCVNGEVGLTEPERLLEVLEERVVSECFDLLFSPDDLAILPARDILAAGAIEFTRHLRRMARRLGFQDPLPCRLNPQFIESLSDSGIMGDEIGLRNLFRRCTQILSGQASELSGARLEQIRESEAGASLPRIRAEDGAVGWRTTVAMSGVGWRLNFWRIPPSSSAEREVIEFAFVERKSDSVHLPT
jgi:hypothetical protein